MMDVFVISKISPKHPAKKGDAVSAGHVVLLNVYLNAWKGFYWHYPY